MTTDKEKVLELIHHMPDNVTLVDIMAKLYLMQKVNQGIKELDNGKGIPHEKVKRKIGGLH